MNVSIVLYNPNWNQVERILRILLTSSVVEKIYLIDNSPTRTLCEHSAEKIDSDRIIYHFVGRNLGYGAAHNIALRESLVQGVKFHLVVNADIEFEPSILQELQDYMQAHQAVGQVMPKVVYPSGETQYLCKLLPTPWDLFMRRFVPQSWRKEHTYRFELRASGYDKIMNVPYLSGCFMLLNVSVLAEVGLFDERFFMYPEDIDLTRRIHRKYQTIFYPDVTIIHNHEKASYKSLRMLWVHSVNICRYFNKWGWFCDSERDEMNRVFFDKLFGNIEKKQ